MYAVLMKWFSVQAFKKFIKRVRHGGAQPKSYAIRLGSLQDYPYVIHDDFKMSDEEIDSLFGLMSDDEAYQALNEQIAAEFDDSNLPT